MVKTPKTQNDTETTEDDIRRLAKDRIRIIVENFLLPRREYLAIINELLPARKYASKHRDLKQFLIEMLGGGPMQLTELRKEAAVHGFNYKAMRRVFNELGGRSRITGYSVNRRALWFLGKERDHIEAYIRKRMGDRGYVVKDITLTKLKEMGFTTKDIYETTGRMGLITDDWRWRLPPYSKTKDGKLVLNRQYDYDRDD